MEFKPVNPVADVDISINSFWSLLILENVVLSKTVTFLIEAYQVTSYAYWKLEQNKNIRKLAIGSIRKPLKVQTFKFVNFNSFSENVQHFKMYLMQMHEHMNVFVTCPTSSHYIYIYIYIPCKNIAKFLLNFRTYVLITHAKMGVNLQAWLIPHQMMAVLFSPVSGGVQKNKNESGSKFSCSYAYRLIRDQTKFIKMMGPVQKK